jgi:S-adenosylmethionine decarboxylase
VSTAGREWIVDAHGCDPARLADLPSLEALFARIVAELRLTPVADPVWHVFPGPGGITGLVPLAESHLTVHTFPEHGSACLDLFCCRERPAWPWEERLRELLGAATVTVRSVERAIDAPTVTPSELAPPAASSRTPQPLGH